MKRFNPTATHPERALQAWVILVSAARNRQTFTYKGLSMLMYGKNAAGVLDKILGCIAFLCDDEEFPPLTTLVVNSKTGRPGLQIPVENDDIDRLREEVFEFDWFDLHPPTIEELATAFDNHV